MVSKKSNQVNVAEIDEQDIDQSLNRKLQEIARQGKRQQEADNDYDSNHDQAEDDFDGEEDTEIKSLPEGEVIQPEPLLSEPKHGDVVYYVQQHGKRVRMVLTREVEETLIKTANDLEIDLTKRKNAFSLLLQAYDKYIKHLVYKDYKYSNVSEEDLSQAAYEGFVEAIKNYDDKKSNGARLITYAYHHIKKNISKLVNAIGYATKTITTKDASLARTAILKIRAERSLTTEDYENIAKTLNNKTAAYVRSIEGALTRPTSFETESSDGDDLVYNPSSFTADEKSDFQKTVEEDEFASQLRTAFFHAFNTVLDEREQYIIKYRVAEDFFPEVKEKSTLNELAVKFNVSNERIRQIENKAKEKLQEALKNFDPTSTD